MQVRGDRQQSPRWAVGSACTKVNDVLSVKHQRCTVGSQLTLTSSTVSGNGVIVSGPMGGGGIDTNAGRVKIQNTIVANNSASFPDVSGALTSLGHNLIGIGTGGSGYVNTDLVGTTSNPLNPLLGPLQDNGGPTQTMALLPGSPAIAAGRSRTWNGISGVPAMPAWSTALPISARYEVQNNSPATHAILLSETMIGVAEIARSQVSTPMPARASTATRAVPLSGAVAVVDQVFATHAGEESQFLLPWLKHDGQGEADWRISSQGVTSLIGSCLAE